uniref:ADF-H domain-containing protein n=1 Tax=Acrobeloides nanus TaxID=290746 RepID=A0A914EEZ4_9BILA
MSGSIVICEIPPDLREMLRKFRLSQSPTTNAAILKIDRKEMCLTLENMLEDCELDELVNELPENQPRFVILSYELKRSDGRVSYPLCLVYYTPPGSSPEMKMLYAGSRNNLVKECELTKSVEIRDSEELTKEFLDSKFS